MKLGLFLKNLGHPIAYYPSLVKVVGGVLPCLFLCQMYYWQGKQKDPDGWIFKSQAEIQEETGMGRREQESARKDLKARGLIQERFAGCPRRLEYLLIDDALEARWQECLQGIPPAIAEVPPAWKRGKSSDKSKTAQSILAKNANMDSQKTELHIGAIEHYVQADPANISLYIPENTNRDYSSPLTPQGAEEKKEEKDAAVLEDPESESATSPHPLPETSRFAVQETQDPTQEGKILPETKIPPRQVEVIPTVTAIEPFGNQRSGLAIARERANGFPDGEWIVDGQIDKNFLEWMGRNYLKSGWGSNIHEAKRRVRGSWNNDPTRLALDWTWYTEEMGHRAANVAVQERAGISGAAVQEHKQFVEKHQRALTNPSPDASHEVAQDLIDLASKQFDPSHHPLDAADSPAALPAEPDWDAIANQQSQAKQEYLASDAYTPQQATVDTPKDEYGQTESGDSYKPYKPAQVEPVPPPKDLLKLVNGLVEAREMKPVAERVGRRNVRAPQKSPIELLNDMLADPILRRDRSVQIRAESYSSLSIEQEYELYRDENGLIYKVEEIQF